MKPLPKLPEEFFDIYKRIGNELRHSNRFTLPSELAKITDDYINWHVNHKLKVIEPGTIFKRARINQHEQYHPYSIDKMGAPPKGQTSSGRINPEGISYIYLADTADTVIAEVRPWKGALVSVADFEVWHKAKVVSLCTRTIDAKGLDPERDINYLVRGSMTSEILSELYFSTPAHGSDKLAYLPSQYLAEMFKSHGIDGIEYKSVLNSGGINLAIFNPDMVRGLSVNQYKVNSVTYDFAPMENKSETASNSQGEG